MATVVKYLAIREEKTGEVVSRIEFDDENRQEVLAEQVAECAKLNKGKKRIEVGGEKRPPYYVTGMKERKEDG